MGNKPSYRLQQLCANDDLSEYLDKTIDGNKS